MKNTIKMSLVAALAVAGLSTTASAGGLEDAIKGVSISGKMEVEYDWAEGNTGTAGATDVTADNWDLDIDVTAKIPVNDMVTATVGLEADQETDTETKAPKNSINLSSMYFTYANAGATVMVGKMGMAGAPWFDDEKAHGLVAMYNAGPVVVAAAHFTSNTAKSDDNFYTGVSLNNAADFANITKEDIAAAAIIAPNIAGTGINASLWYADISNIADSYSIAVDGKIADMVGFEIRHTDVDYGELAAGSEADLTKVIVNTDLGMANVFLGYGNADNKGTNVGVDLTGDTDAETNFALDQLSLDDLADADAWLIGASATFDATTLTAAYLDGEAGNTDFDELMVKAEYKMSSNFTVDVEYSTAEVGTADKDEMNIALEYKF